GEVLKYMGDGLLAIFPIADNAPGICRAALAAARTFRAAVTTLNAATGDPAQRLRFGLALHIGEVLYGNIGGGNRLDFTAIGPAVNLAARLEKLARDRNRAIVASGRFAEACAEEFVPLGELTLRGVSTPQPAFALAEEEAPPHS